LVHPVYSTVTINLASGSIFSRGLFLLVHPVYSTVTINLASGRNQTAEEVIRRAVAHDKFESKNDYELILSQFWV